MGVSKNWEAAEGAALVTESRLLYRLKQRKTTTAESPSRSHEMLQCTRSMRSLQFSRYLPRLHASALQLPVNECTCSCVGISNHLKTSSESIDTWLEMRQQISLSSHRY